MVYDAATVHVSQLILFVNILQLTHNSVECMMLLTFLFSYHLLEEPTNTYHCYWEAQFTMSAASVIPEPKSMTRAKKWSDEVEEAYRFQVAGYKGEAEYIALKGLEVITKI